MIMTSMQLIIAAVMLLAQPVQHDDDHGHVSNGVAVAWSHDLPPEQPAQPSAKAVAHREVEIPAERSKPAAHAGATKQVALRSREMPRAKPADVPSAAKAATDPDTTRAKIGDTHPATDAAANSKPKTIQGQAVAAAAVAEHVTSAKAIAAPEQKANNTDTEKTAAASPDNTDHLVAILMAGPEIKSVSDLAGKTIAIDDRQSASHASIRTAIVAAGAVEVQLSEGQTTAINRVTSGEVPAAVLTLESPEAAEGFPEIAGFKIFRIPLSPRALKARDDKIGHP
jgi:hypothetical protein